MTRHRILIFHIGSLGDTLIAIPALWAVKDNFPNAHITMLTDNQMKGTLVKACDILDGSGLIDEYIYYSVGKPIALFQILIKLRYLKFDSVVYLIRSYIEDNRISRDKFFFFLAGINDYIGMQGFIKNPILNKKRFLPELQRMGDIILSRLHADGLDIPTNGEGRVDVNIGRREHDNIKQWLIKMPDDRRRPWIAIGPGSKMSCKIWPYERYLKVIKSLISEFNIWPLIFGGPSDQELGLRLIKELGCGYVPAGTLNIRDSMAAMEKCLLYLGNDTGTMHMAAASKVKCVVPFSSRDIPGLWEPYGEGHIIFRTSIDCEGCMLENCVDRRMECILSISVQQVTDACRIILSKLIPK